MQKTKLINRIIGIAGLIITLLIVLNFFQVNTYLVAFSEKYISHDHHVKPNTIFLIKILAVPINKIHIDRNILILIDL